MAASTITQRIALEGADQIKQALAQIGKTGQEAFQQIQQAGEGIKLDQPLGAVEAAARRSPNAATTPSRSTPRSPPTRHGRNRWG